MSFGLNVVKIIDIKSIINISKEETFVIIGKINEKTSDFLSAYHSVPEQRKHYDVVKLMRLSTVLVIDLGYIIALVFMYSMEFIY